MDILVREQTFRLTPEHCLYWPAQKLLAVADIHLGKAEVFQRSGLFMPGKINGDDLARLAAVAEREGAKEIIFLGDFVHSVFGLTEELIENFAKWRDSYQGLVTVLLGNHDRGLEKRWPDTWKNVVIHNELHREGFTFQHEPPTSTMKNFCWAGHVHPVVSLSSGSDSLRLPCFYLEDNVGLLPAFSSLAGGQTMNPKPWNRVYAVAGERIVKVGK